MNTDFLKYFQTIGKLTRIVSLATDLDAVLKESVATILPDVPSDYVLIWFKDGERLKPYYWIGDSDFTQMSVQLNESTVGHTFTSQTSLRLFTQADIDRTLDSFERAGRYGNGAVSSMICVPMASQYDHLGCIQFIRTVNKEAYTEEQADICEIFSSVLAMKIEDNPNIDKGDRFDRQLLSARNIQKTFINGENHLQVLKGVNMDVFEGELLVVLGESGCGKSTFLNIIGGMETCDAGEFSFMGQNMTKADKTALTLYRRKNIGFIFQSYNLMPNLTAIENLKLIAELVDYPLDCEEALRMVGLYEKKDNYPAQLSGGQQQRVSIARALVKRPKLIFADEPTAALDYATSIEVLSVLKEVARRGTTVVMVTHNEEITKMADRVVRMRNGKSYETTVNKHPVDASELVW